MTLTLSDIKEVILRPKEIVLGTSLQFFIMLLLGFLLAKIFRLSLELAAGVILLGTCPGGAASNVIAYLAKGDVALSVKPDLCFYFIVSSANSLMAYLYAHKIIYVPVFGLLFLSALQILIAPVAIGIAIRKIIKDKTVSIIEFLTSVSTITIIFIVGVIVTVPKESITRLGLIIVLHNSFGLAIGYTAARLLGMDRKKGQDCSNRGWNVEFRAWSSAFKDSFQFASSPAFNAF
ncbi:MAG: bile acid:sodium symporter family protein [Candidatus Dadabacteria bacterium]|nr:bile acid:sodium symporter family protein [Candidatus Dadabacteria bacterium]